MLQPSPPPTSVNAITIEGLVAGLRVDLLSVDEEFLG